MRGVRPVVPFIKILSHAGIAAVVVQALPPGGLVGSAAEQLPINETLHRYDRMPVGSLPVG